jgi:adenosylcobinamide amidohydrolase
LSHAELCDLADQGAVAALVWRLDRPLLVASTAVVGGGAGLRSWVLNAQVAPGYSRTDVVEHVAEMATALGLHGAGVGMLTAAPVAEVTAADDGGVIVHVTVGLGHPTWAAEPAHASGPHSECQPAAGTINVVASVPERHTDAAMANLMCTLTEAKVQALLDCGVPATGTASDAVTVLCPAEGPVEPFGGPRSRFGACAARAAYAAIRAGVEAAIVVAGGPANDTRA